MKNVFMKAIIHSKNIFSILLKNIHTRLLAMSPLQHKMQISPNLMKLKTQQTLCFLKQPMFSEVHLTGTGQVNPYVNGEHKLYNKELQQIRKVSGAFSQVRLFESCNMNFLWLEIPFCALVSYLWSISLFIYILLTISIHFSAAVAHR